MKKKIWILIAFTIVFSSAIHGFNINIASAEEVNYETIASLEEAVQSANEEYESVTGDPNYIDISKVNRDMYDKYGVLVYGDPHGDKKGSESRYVGYTPMGEPFGNPVFPRDDWTGGTFDERNWIKEPWKNSFLRGKYGITYSAFNGTEAFTENMKASLLKYYPDDTDGSRNDWHLYMQILQQ